MNQGEKNPGGQIPLQPHPDVPTARFWNSLPRTPLTQGALMELQGRNSSKYWQRRKRVAFLRANAKMCPKLNLEITDLRGYPHPLDDKTEQLAAELGKRKINNAAEVEAAETTVGYESSHYTCTAIITKATNYYDAAFEMHLIHMGIMEQYMEKNMGVSGVFERSFMEIDGEDYECLEDAVDNLRQQRKAEWQSSGHDALNPSNMTELEDLLHRAGSQDWCATFDYDGFINFAAAIVLLRSDASPKRLYTSVLPVLEGDKATDPGGMIDGAVLFSNLAHLTDGSLPAGLPDRFYGSPVAAVDAVVLHDLFHLIVPNDSDPVVPVAPNCFLETCFDADAQSQQMQAFYHGMLGERGILHLRGYGRGEGAAHALDGRAHTLTGMYKRGVLTLWVVHAVRRDGGVRYVVTHVADYFLRRSFKTYCEGMTAYRLLRAWAKQQREEAIAMANAQVRGA